MGLPVGTYRHIEAGRRLLPYILDTHRGDSELVAWIRKFNEIVAVTPDEESMIWKTVRHQALAQFADALRILNEEIEDRGAK
jgi:hypothetical protein